ncbi:MAG: Mth938-like domain-containing protein [Rhodospirillaceae bacterium]|nr:Mth938-like domain-containing protein [Rhodospirillaceae bacterium]
MELTEAARGERPFVESYGPGGFRIGGERWAGSVLILTDRAVSWDCGDLADLDAEALTAAFAEEAMELLILGLGAGAASIPPATREALREAGLAVEAMDTGAACRTYNLLAGEGRAVGAALMALPGG